MKVHEDIYVAYLQTLAVLPCNTIIYYHGRPQNFSRGKRRNVTYPFQVADDAMQLDVHKMLYPIYPISLCCLNLQSQSFVWNVFYI